jgi:hypothetical protein
VNHSIVKTTILGGAVLVLLSVVGVAGAIAHGKTFVTALIPFVMGDLLIILGVLSLKLPQHRKHFMHGAAMVALLTTLLAAMPLVIRTVKGTISEAAATTLISIGGMFIAGVVLLVLYVRSFIAASRARKMA